MERVKWRSDLEEWADFSFLEERGAVKKKTFGCPSYYFGKKMFAFLYQDGLGIKLNPKKVVQQISANPEKYFPFNPGDGTMKNWLIIICPEALDYQEEKPMIESAIESALEEFLRN